jgi:hypothetical protein
VVVSNIGALVKDKIRRLGQANVSEEEALQRTASRLGASPRPTGDPDSKEAQVQLETFFLIIFRNEKPRCS